MQRFLFGFWTNYTVSVHRPSARITLHPLQPRQARVLGGDSDYFWDSMYSIVEHVCMVYLSICLR